MTAAGRLASDLTPYGMRPWDQHECSQLNELKINTAGLNMLAGWGASGDTILMEQMPMFGGYVGGAEETAICDVASTIASFALFDSDIHLDGPIHIRWGTTTTRETIQVAAHAAAALDQNTDFLLANQYYTMAGPCTDMCLLEIAAQAMADTASGREILSGVASAKGVSLDRTSGMEARMMGEVSLATCGMDIADVNETIDNVLRLYERDFARAPQGKCFQECYDLRSLEPTDEYIDIYDRVIDTLGRCGLGLRGSFLRQIESDDTGDDHRDADPASDGYGIPEDERADQHGYHGSHSDPYRIARSCRKSGPEALVEEEHAQRHECKEQDVVEQVRESVRELHEGRPSGLEQSADHDPPPGGVHADAPENS